MSCIDDEGKIWLQGKVKPEYGLRVDHLYFIPGKEDTDSINCCIYKNYLYVELYNHDEQYRIIRRFALDLTPTLPGALFSGFTKTKHADIEAITYQDNRIDTIRVNKEGSLWKKNELIDPEEIIRLTGWK